MIAKAQSLANQENLTAKAKRTQEEKVRKLQIQKNQHWNKIVRIQERHVQEMREQEANLVHFELLANNLHMQYISKKAQI